MIIHIEICDLCDAPVRGAVLEAYRIAEGPTLHICRICQEKPIDRHTVPSPKGVAVLRAVNMMLGVT